MGVTAAWNLRPAGAVAGTSAGAHRAAMIQAETNVASKTRRVAPYAGRGQSSFAML
jgi:hypothetical protein